MRVLALILLAIGAAQLLLLPLCTPVLADGGIIPLSHILGYGPGQKAIIAWDGEQEILILSIDVYAEGQTKALHVVPLPAEPDKIEQGDFESFERVAELVRDYISPPSGWFDCGGGGEGAGGGVDIVFHERIGAHDILVAKATDAGEFVNWAEDYLAANQIQYQISSPEVESVVAEYIAEGIEFFVFDLIELSSDPESVEPIVYQFQSDTLYYPLRISSIIPGYTEIRLFLLTPEPLSNLDGLPETSWLGESRWYDVGIAPAQYRERPIQFEIDSKKLASIDQRVAELFDRRAWLTYLVSYSGNVYDRAQAIPLASLEEDVRITKDSYGEPPEEIPRPGPNTWGWVLVGIFGAVLAAIVGRLIYIFYRTW